MSAETSEALLLDGYIPNARYFCPEEDITCKARRRFTSQPRHERRLRAVIGCPRGLDLSHSNRQQRESETPSPEYNSLRAPTAAPQTADWRFRQWPTPQPPHS